MRKKKSSFGHKKMHLKLWLVMRYTPSRQVTDHGEQVRNPIFSSSGFCCRTAQAKNGKLHWACLGSLLVFKFVGLGDNWAWMHRESKAGALQNFIFCDGSD